MEITKLEELANNLIKAIDENEFEGQDREREEDTDIFITQRFIADELEELRDYLQEGKKKEVIKALKEEIKLCHDENCPECNWEETLRVCDKNMNTIRFECYKCGWKKEIK